MKIALGCDHGGYDLKLYVVSSAKRKLYIRVNKYESTVVSDVIGVTGDSNAVGCKSAQVYLDKGMNTIYLYNPTSTAPDLDRIAVSKAAVSAGTAPSVTDSDSALYEDYRTPVETPTPTATPTPTPPQSQPPVVSPEPDKPVVQPTQDPKPDKVVKPAKVKKLKVKSKKKKQIKVTFGKVNKADGYQICYAANKKFKKAKKVLVKATDKTIKKLKAKKKYYVRVRAYRKNGSKKLYGAWSSVKKVKVK